MADLPPGQQTLTIQQAIDLGLEYHNAGHLPEAESIYQQILQSDPNQPVALHLLGVIAYQVGKNDIAIDLIGKALVIYPDFAEAHSNLGNVLQEQGKLDDAITSYRKALALNPHHAEAHYNLGNALKEQEKLDDAAESYRNALAVHPDFSEAHSNLGNVLKEQGKLDDAVTSYHKALAINPDYAEAHYNLGNALKEQEKLDDAAASYRKALAINPDFSEAHSNLGIVLKEQGKLDDAVISYRNALAINPDYAEAHYNLGNVLKEQGKLGDALASYRLASNYSPRSFQYALSGSLVFPIIPQSSDDIYQWREHYKDYVEKLRIGADEYDELDKPINGNVFYLSYHNLCNRRINEQRCNLIRLKLQSLNTVSPTLQSWKGPAPKIQKIKIGVVSEFLYNHTIGKLNVGLLQQLDHNRFEVVVFHLPEGKDDHVRCEIDTLATRSVRLPRSIKRQQKAIISERVDVLYYPEIGMGPHAYTLALSRLAPVQVVSWGHPDTTGIDTIDYFLSAISIEPANSDEHYTETLVRLTRLPCYYAKPNVPIDLLTREELGLPEQETLYGCPQSLFKFHPDFDQVLVAIAEGDPNGRIVLIEGTTKEWGISLRKRWQKIAPILSNRVLFLPRMPTDAFMSFLSHIDVLLDPIHFGSGNTMYEAMAIGTPIVTWPGQFMRSRVVAGAYHQMKINDAPIANHLKDYAPLALKLGRDPERRKRLRKTLSEASTRELFSDKVFVREFEIFVESALASAIEGKTLPIDWNKNA